MTRRAVVKLGSAAGERKCDRLQFQSFAAHPATARTMDIRWKSKRAQHSSAKASGYLASARRRWAALTTADIANRRYESDGDLECGLAEVTASDSMQTSGRSASSACCITVGVAGAHTVSGVPTLRGPFGAGVIRRIAAKPYAMASHVRLRSPLCNRTPRSARRDAYQRNTNRPTTAPAPADSAMPSEYQMATKAAVCSGQCRP